MEIKEASEAHLQKEAKDAHQKKEAKEPTKKMREKERRDNATTFSTLVPIKHHDLHD